MSNFLKRQKLKEANFVEIPGYPDYWAREDGLVASSNNREISEPKILSPLVINSGYQTVQVKQKGKHVRRTVHRLIALAYIENPLNLPEINHKNGIKTDNNRTNLEWSTRKNNINHAIETGLTISHKGEECHSCKITEKIAIEIHGMYTNGDTAKKISERFNISTKQVQSIATGRKWKHLNLTKVYRGKAKGENHIRSVFSQEDVLRIKTLLQENSTISEISKIFGCSKSAISHIKHGRTWKDI